MKVSELKETIRAKVREAVIIQQTGAPLTDPQLSQKIKTLRAKEGDPTIGTEKNAVKVVREEDFLDDDDNTFIEGVDDDNTDFKDYDSIYEINANVAPGSRYQIEVRKDGNFIILTQDNGQEIVVNPEDVRDLVKVILKIDNEGN